MKTCLLHVRTFERRKTELLAFADKIDFILLQEDDTFLNHRTGEVSDAADPDIVFGNADAWFGAQVRQFFKTILSASDLQWFQSAAAGMDNPALAQIYEKAVFYTTNHTQSEPMAEWALWQALDWLKHGSEHRSNQQKSHWERLHQREIMGSNWLIVGYGSIGESVGKRVQALGGTVTGLRRSPGPAAGADQILHPDELMEELPKADVVLLCLPHTPATEDMADTRFFATMKDDAMFINLGRGALVDEGALVAGLDAGKPSFAALDVVREEPLPEESPIWKHPRIALTPHDSSQTPGTVLRADETFLANLALYVSGEPLMHVVKK